MWDILDLGSTQCWNEEPTKISEFIYKHGYKYNAECILYNENAIRKLKNIDINNRIIAYDEFLPCVLGLHPRDDLKDLFNDIERLYSVLPCEVMAWQEANGISDTRKNDIIINFVNDNINIEKYKDIYGKKNIVTIPNFVSEKVLRDIKPELENYEWWLYATTPHNGESEVNYAKHLSEDAIESCKNAYINKQFTYRFRRSSDDHYDSCNCVSCRLCETCKSSSFKDTLCNIVGCENLTPGELFISNYGKDDFLSMHHDKQKGDIAVTISFAYDWDPVYGGILHFCDDEKNIHTSVSPNAGSMNIFKLDKNNGVSHFVSPVNVDKNRYSLTAWYYEK